MAQSVIDLGDVCKLRAAILTNKENSIAETNQFCQSADALLAQFQAKLAALEQEKERAYQALCQCELHKHDDEDNTRSCDAEESAYQHAAARYERCLRLVNQAQSAISIFKSRAAQSREAITDLASRSERGLSRIENTVNEYLGNIVPTTVGGGVGGPMPMGENDNQPQSGDRNQPQGGGGSPIHSGGDSGQAQNGEMNPADNENASGQNMGSDNNAGGMAPQDNDGERYVIQDNDSAPLSAEPKGGGWKMAAGVGGAILGAGVVAGTIIKKGIGKARDIASKPSLIQQMENEDRKRYQKLQEDNIKIEEKLRKEKEEKDKTEIFMAKVMGNGKIKWEDKQFDAEFKNWKNTREAKEMLANAQNSFNNIKPDLENGITYKQLEDVVNGVINLKPEEIAYFTTDIGEKGTAGIVYRHLPTNAYVDRVYKGQMSVCQTIGVAAHEGAHVWQLKASKLSEIWSKPEFLKEEKHRKFFFENKKTVDYYKKIRNSMKNREPYENRFHEKEARKVQYVIGKACTAYYNSTITPKKKI